MPDYSNPDPDGAPTIFCTAVIYFASFMWAKSSPTSRLNKYFDLVLNSKKFSEGKIGIVEELLGLLDNTPGQDYADDVVDRLKSVDNKLVKYADNIAVVVDGKNERVISDLLGRIRAITEPNSRDQLELSGARIAYSR